MFSVEDVVYLILALILLEFVLATVFMIVESTKNARSEKDSANTRYDNGVWERVRATPGFDKSIELFQPTYEETVRINTYGARVSVLGAISNLQHWRETHLGHDITECTLYDTAILKVPSISDNHFGDRNEVI